VLGVLLAFVGLQHSLLARDLARGEEIAVSLGIAVLGFVTQNLAIGFGVGIVLHQGWLLGRGFLTRQAMVRSSRSPLC